MLQYGDPCLLQARYAAEKEAVVAKAGKVEREEGQPPRPKGPFFYFLAAFKEQYKVIIDMHLHNVSLLLIARHVKA